MLICGVDLETTGLDTEALHVTELCGVLFDTRLGRTAGVLSILVKLPEIVALPEDCAELSNLDEKILRDHGSAPREAFLSLFEMMGHAEAFVAHNATHFERKILSRYARELELELPGKPWIDTAVDVEYPRQVKGRSLTHIAADYGFLNPFPHEACPDVLTMLRILASNDVAAALDNATAPKVTIRAMVEYEDRDKAKAAGFYFEPKTKRWLKTMRVDRASAAEYDFRTIVVGEAKP